MSSWHALSPNQVASQLETDRVYGLPASVAAARLGQYGPNRLPSARRKGPALRFLSQFHNPLIYVLLAAGTATLLMEDLLDTAVIFGVVLVNAVIAFIQEGKAERALEAVQNLLSQKATVIRSGERLVIDAAELVPGDLVALESGDSVPADLRLVRAHNFSTIESALTGESVPVAKKIDQLDPGCPLAERSNLVFAGTQVATGNARGLVVATATGTELGKIGKLVSGLPSLSTPLTRRLDGFAKQVTGFVLALGAVVFASGYFFAGYPPEELFLAVVGLAVAAIPEGLPAVVTIALAFGTRAMARVGALVRRLPAVEGLGSVSVICSDKTGTLTKNEMTVTEILLPGQHVIVSGSGYDPVGQFSTQPKSLEEFLECAAVCNHSELRQVEGHWQIIGDPTEGALTVVAAKAGVYKQQLGYELIDELPFESEHRMMATEVRTPNGYQLFIKGAPEEVIALCELSPEDEANWHALTDQAASKGQRVLALAAVELEAPMQLEFGALPKPQLLGFACMIDPPREEAIESIQNCQRAGITVKMITGDHVVTAAAIGSQLGLAHSGAIDGSEIDALSDDELAKRLSTTDIVARANPEHKLRLVNILQQRGALVAMTGDGVNDAPALKTADLGVAMGLKGTDAARAAADIVLTDDNFATIAHAVERGRVVFDNIKKSLLFMLPTNLGEAGVIVLALLAGISLPVTPAQILWINMVTAVTLAFALVFEPPERNVMQRGPLAAGSKLIGSQALLRLIFVALLMVAATFAIFNLELGRGSDLETARTAAVAMLVIAEIAYLFNVRRFVASAFRAGKNNSVWLVVGILLTLQLGFTYLPAMNVIFGSRPLDAQSWAWVVLGGVLVFVAVEIEKLARRIIGKDNI